MNISWFLPSSSGIIFDYLYTRGKSASRSSQGSFFILILILSTLRPTKFFLQEIRMEEICHLQLDQSTAKDECSNLSLRLLDLSDIDDFMVWATDEKVTRFCSWEPYTNKEDGLNFIRNTVLPHPWFRAICLDDRPIGAISVTENSGNDKCRGELGYVLASKYWGKGIATRAVKMVAKTIFVDWPHLVLYVVFSLCLLLGLINYYYYH